ncbi:MAG: RlpA-like double-psi beta-barrel domain-containing protein [archaeon]|nr:RlpA-like double-psi beta-barrel domain-containing protein [archaeon]
MIIGLCGSCIRVHGTKATITGTMLDKCPGCSWGALDVSKDAFVTLFGDSRIGRVHNVSWESC